RVIDACVAEMPGGGWRLWYNNERDGGIVIRSGAATNFNAIDPALLRDREGRLWMSFGSYWSGLKLVELDPATGRLLRPEAAPHALAHDRSIEAAFIHQRGDQFYLFGSYGWCCRGINSTYHIRVGRSAAITGPYRDRDGRALLEGGGTLVLASEGPFIGPGHPSIMAIDGREWFGCHFYDATQRGRPTYALRPLGWDAEGWPLVGKWSTSL
ncbi:MAG: arabinan endo-1,5-alpha-L-arabinosidase, partial [Verrucomicrobia bacterium]|nr:arabinan endo-1,5-alpha-L-arabinosidase [Verrucomicrobiota bacterium]